MLSQTISKLSQTSRNERQQIDDLYKLILLKLKSLEICLQEYPQHLSHIQSMKHLLDDIQILENQNQQIEGQKLILEQIRVEESQVRQQRIVQYQSMIEEVRSLLQTKEDNIKRLTTLRTRTQQAQQDNTGEMLYNELSQTSILVKLARQQYAKLKHTADKVRFYKNDIKRMVDRIKSQVTGKSQAYSKFLSEGKIDLPKYNIQKVEGGGYDDLRSDYVHLGKPQLWFSSRLYQIRTQNIKLLKKLKQQIDLTIFMAKDYEVLVKKYMNIPAQQELHFSNQGITNKTKDIKNNLKYNLQDWESVKSL